MLELVVMERKSFGWVWAGVGVVAVVILVASATGRRSRAPLLAGPGPMQPIIVEPIQPNPAMPPMALPVGPEPLPEHSAVEGPVAPVSPAAAMDAPTVTTLGLPEEGPERIRLIQQALHAAGYHPGPVDGKLGRLTQRAIREFQEAHGLSVDGKVGPKTWAKLEPYLRTNTSASATSRR